jgi:Ca-activated chloride channel family protein
MKTILLIIISLAFTFSSSAKIITGLVVDRSTSSLPGVVVAEKGTVNSVITDISGYYKIEVKDEKAVLIFSFIGFDSQEYPVKGKDVINVTMKENISELDEVVVVGYGEMRMSDMTGSVASVPAQSYSRKSKGSTSSYYYCPPPVVISNTEHYEGINENKFFDPIQEPLSTFSVDVDRASYTNIRRFINNGTLPPVDAVRIEEMINYFAYDYDEPKGDHSFAIHHEVATCPWNKQHYLMKVALQGKRMKKDKLPPSNLVFLLDVSGSMNASNKLPLLKSALKLLVNELREEDKVSIVVYAGAAGVVLEPTSGRDKNKIIEALDQLNAGGSTAGGAGLRLAYKLANKNLFKEGNNRIILATDGDFNVGVSSNNEMEKLIVSERDKGIFITVAGFGIGNYKDSKMEIIADKGNGNYFYIDNIQEAKKAMVEEFGGTLYTIAKDVKFQLEFNPQHIAGYRLIGYENRLLNKEDFNDDKKDAGEIGSGHTVTALYEIIPVAAEDIKEYLPGVDPLKYQPNKNDVHVKKSVYSDELLTLKLRYKEPNGTKSKLIVKPVKNKIVSIKEAGVDFKFAASVAAWGMKLRDSDYIEDVSYEAIIEMAKKSKGNDEQGYRAEMVRLMESARLLSKGLVNK